VVNRTLIDQITNKRISDRAPSNYLDEIRRAYEEKGLPGEAFEGLLRSHLLPAGPDSPLWRDDFEGFLAWRQEAIWQLIRKVTGVREASDLISESIA
jgi:hypothetical protein